MNKFSKGLDIHLCNKLTRTILNKTKNNKLLFNIQTVSGHGKGIKSLA